MTTHTMITVSITVNAPIEKVWDCWTNPNHITGWNFASDDWECPQATNALVPGGSFSYTMAAKDGSASFDFGGTFIQIQPLSRIAYTIDGGRMVDITFMDTAAGVVVTEAFEPEQENPLEMQEAGWQSILNNFKKYVENNQVASNQEQSN